MSSLASTDARAAGTPLPDGSGVDLSAASERETVAPPPCVAAFEAAVRERGEWQARLANLAELMEVV